MEVGAQEVVDFGCFAPRQRETVVTVAGGAGYDMLVAAAVPILVMVTVRAALTCPTTTLPKASDEVDALTLGLAPPPGRLAPWRLARRK